MSYHVRFPVYSTQYLPSIAFASVDLVSVKIRNKWEMLDIGLADDARDPFTSTCSTKLEKMSNLVVFCYFFSSQFRWHSTKQEWFLYTYINVVYITMMCNSIIFVLWLIEKSSKKYRKKLKNGILFTCVTHLTHIWKYNHLLQPLVILCWRTFWIIPNLYFNDVP